MPVQLKEVKDFIGQNVKIEGKVYGTKDLGSRVLVNVGGAYPNQLLTVVLKGDAKTPASRIDGKTIIVTGTLVDYKGKPEIIVTEATQIQIVSPRQP